MLPSGRRRPRQPCRQERHGLRGGIGFHGGFGRRFRNGHGILGLRGLRSGRSGGRGRLGGRLGCCHCHGLGRDRLGRSRLGSRLRCGLHYWGRGRLYGRCGNILGNLLCSGRRGDRLGRSDLCRRLGDGLLQFHHRLRRRLGCCLLDHRLATVFHRRSLAGRPFSPAPSCWQRLVWPWRAQRPSSPPAWLAFDRRFLCGGLPGRRATCLGRRLARRLWQRALPPTSSQQA